MRDRLALCLFLELGATSYDFRGPRLLAPAPEKARVGSMRQSQEEIDRARWRVWDGEARIAAQRVLIARLRRDEPSTERAEMFLSVREGTKKPPQLGASGGLEISAARFGTGRAGQKSFGHREVDTVGARRAMCNSAGRDRPCGVSPTTPPKRAANT